MLEHFHKKIQKALEMFKTFKDIDREAYEIHSYRDWKLVVCGFFILGAVSAIGAFYLFIQVNSGEIFSEQDASGVSVKTINEKLLKQVLLDYKQKKSDLEKIIYNKPDVLDPSIAQ